MDEAARGRTKMRAILAMVLATGAFTAGDCCMKFAARALPASEVLFIRSTICVLILLAVATATSRLASLRSSVRPPVLVRGVAEFVGTMLFVAALVVVPISTVTAIAQIVPVIVTLLGAFVLAEKVGLHRWAAVAVGLAGAILVARPSGEGFNTYTLLAFGVPFVVALRDLVARSIGTSIALLPVLFGLVAVLAVGALLAAPFGEPWLWPGGEFVALLALAAFLVLIGHGGTVLAVRSVEMSEIAPFYFVQTLWSVLAGMMVFGENPSLGALLGMTLIVGSGLYILHRERVKRRRPTPPALVA